MNVTIIGAGNMGRGIGHVLMRGGHSATIVDRDPDQAEQLLKRARQLEGLGFLGIALQQPMGLNFQSAWKLIS